MKWLTELEKTNRKYDRLRKAGWTRHFAWLPVEVDENWVWLEHYERKFHLHDRGSDHFIYRLPTEQS